MGTNKSFPEQTEDPPDISWVPEVFDDWSSFWMTLQTLAKVWTFCVRAALEITKLECLNEVYHYTDYKRMITID